MNWKTENWWVSHLNFLPEVRAKLNLPESVLIHDVTLRDGEQQAGLVFGKEDKIEIARKLDEVGVHRIEAGMPAVSPDDKSAIKAIVKEDLDAQIFAFSRCMKGDVDLAVECDVDGVVMEIPASEHIIKHAYQWPLEKAINLPAESTAYAKDHGLYVTFFTIDSTRADLDWWFKILETVASEGHMDALALVDTFGVCNPEAIRYFTKKACERFDKPVEIHSHNDFGLGVANALAAISEGAEVAHTTVNTLGERVGNAALDEVVLGLEALYGIKVGLNYEKLTELSALVAKLSKIEMPPHKPIVGKGVYRIESGIVSSWWKKVEKEQPLVMYPFKWDFVGQDGVELVLGKASGHDSIVHKLNQLGLSIPEDQIDELLAEVKMESSRNKNSLTDEQFKQLVDKWKRSH